MRPLRTVCLFVNVFRDCPAFLTRPSPTFISYLLFHLRIALLPSSLAQATSHRKFTLIAVIFTDKEALTMAMVVHEI